IYMGGPGTISSITLYEDDGNSMEYASNDAFCTLKITCRFQDGKCTLNLSPLQGNYSPEWKQIKYIIYAEGEIKLKEISSFSKSGKTLNFSY
ncbi:MAG: DUF5110 domain-containing protein, partial [Promethearchaeia archaeon]